MAKTDQLTSSIYFNLQAVRKMITDTIRNTVKEKK